jgi:thiol-disulfide isomerase/thioredoxin
VLPHALRSGVAVVGMALLTTVFACKSKGDAEPKAEPTKPTVAFTEVRPKEAEGELLTLLAFHAKTARAQGLVPYAELGATWCKPCRELETSMTDPRMKDAFKGTYIVHLDVDEWGSALAKASLRVGSIPKIVALDAEGKGTSRTIDGGAWEANIPANMAPVLARFFHSTE